MIFKMSSIVLLYSLSQNNLLVYDLYFQDSLLRFIVVICFGYP
jgi:hypothetical protein